MIGSALAHPSFRNENGCAFPHDFDRLEFFGDAVLNFLVCRKLFDRFPQADEGLLSRMRSILVSRKILFRIARTIGLRKYVKIGRSLRHQPLKDLAKILADTLEALIAAIFLEHGHETTDAFIEKYLGEYLAPQKLFRLDPNPKSTLQELTQRYWQTLPAYEAKELVNGFEVRITVGSQKVRVRAPSKSQGEVSAARMMLRKIRSRKGLRRSAK
ncbi:MAG: ribonuclease III family protein [Candidatus Omnitrophota bacterium]